MERLTIHSGMYKRLDPEQAEAIYKKLRAYEDTGLEPEEVEAAKKIAEWFTSLFKDAKEWWNDMVPRNKEGDSMLVEKPTGTIRTAYDSNNDPYLFEATGAEAKRFMDILNADDEGRLVVLPCKVGDFLYEIDLPEYGVIKCKALSVDYYNGPLAHVPNNEMVELWSAGVEVVEGHGTGSCYAFEQTDFGKTVFLSREEAEKALEVSENEPI